MRFTTKPWCVPIRSARANGLSSESKQPVVKGNANMPYIENTLAVVLATSENEELMPLVAHRTKAAIPFGGNYRVIDFPLTNCLSSGLRKILVLTQYKSHSLHKHLRDGWSVFNPELGEFVTPVPPQRLVGDAAYRGPLDAIKKNAFLIERSSCDYICLLSGEHIYRMDYAAMLDFHVNNNAGITLACNEVNRPDTET